MSAPSQNVIVSCDSNLADAESSLWESTSAGPDCLQFQAGLKKKRQPKLSRSGKAVRNKASESTKWPASNTDGYTEIPCEFLSCIAQSCLKERKYVPLPHSRGFPVKVIFSHGGRVTAVTDSFMNVWDGSCVLDAHFFYYFYVVAFTFYLYLRNVILLDVSIAEAVFFFFAKDILLILPTLNSDISLSFVCHSLHRNVLCSFPVQWAQICLYAVKKH
jgi:hypothetical protein